jgi:hypothetical protein
MPSAPCRGGRGERYAGYATRQQRANLVDEIPDGLARGTMRRWSPSPSETSSLRRPAWPAR